MFILSVALSMINAKGNSPLASQLVNLTPVPFTQVRINDKFWTPRREVNRTVSLTHSLDMLEKAGNVKDFELAAAGKHEGYQGPVFMDSDLYKTLEAVSYSLATNPDPALSARIDSIIAKMGSAQMADGYLNTYYQVNEPTRRFTNLRDNHELYCAGHMFEAAVAHFQATGKKNLLNIATKYADFLVRTFGDGPDHRMGYPGHPEIELALVKLANATGNQSYFHLAEFFVTNRGKHFFATEHKTPEANYDGTYWIDDVPITEHKNIKGHAVRAAYLMSGTTDVAAKTQSEALLQMLNRVWRNTTEKNLYITGGIGPSGSNEGFTTDFDLPNLSAYQETCASVALAQWNHRLGLAYGDAKYADLVERSLYNGVISGVSCDGKKFFYVNPLESTGGHHRSEWFGCACCPPNVARTLASLGGYAYATSADSLYVNLYIAGSVDAKVSGKDLHFDVQTDYPWDGRVKIAPRIAQPTSANLKLRIPTWCTRPTLSVNGKTVALSVDHGYAVIRQSWKTGDSVELDLPMPIERIAANPNVKDDQFKTAFQRGPLVYCIESTDQTADLGEVAIPIDAAWKAQKANVLGGIITLEGSGIQVADNDWQNRLYQPAPIPTKVALKAIPYCYWDNRTAGRMEVWMPTAIAPKPVRGLEGKAKVSLSFVSGNCQPWGINDGKDPKSSAENPGQLCHWWPHHGGTEWAQYTWKTPVTVTGSKVYWFDDSHNGGGCRLPASWKMQYLEGQTWRDIPLKTSYPIAPDKWCEVAFAPIKTTALRLSLNMQTDWAAGIHEWKVVEED